MTRIQQITKTTIDRVAAAILLLLASPIFLVAAVAIRLSSRGPVFFTQERIGLAGWPFRMFKFRTMHRHTPRQGHEFVTVRNDPRVFWTGEVLRKWKIDELPQLVNVLNGTMSLVGPRPTVASDYERMNDEQRGRLDMKPGLTGLAQINGGASISWPRRIEYDLDYIRNYRLARDIRILFSTALLVVLGQADAVPETNDEWSELDANAKSQKTEARADKQVA